MTPKQWFISIVVLAGGFFLLLADGGIAVPHFVADFLEGAR